MQGLIAKQVWYSGEVQGHDFRHAIYQEAFKHDVTGHVQNWGDGRVEVKVMGYENVVDEFLQAIRELDVEVTIANEEIKEIKPLRGMSGFKVR